MEEQGEHQIMQIPSQLHHCPFCVYACYGHLRLLAHMEVLHHTEKGYSRLVGFFICMLCKHRVNDVLDYESHLKDFHKIKQDDLIRTMDLLDHSRAIAERREIGRIVREDHNANLPKEPSEKMICPKCHADVSEVRNKTFADEQSSDISQILPLDLSHSNIALTNELDVPLDKNLKSNINTDENSTCSTSYTIRPCVIENIQQVKAIESFCTDKFVIASSDTTCGQPMYKCYACRILFNSQNILNIHYRSKKHKIRVASLQVFYDPNRPCRCDICEVSFSQRELLAQHFRSKKHIERINNLLASNLKQNRKQQHTATVSSGQQTIDSNSNEVSAPIMNCNLSQTEQYYATRRFVPNSNQPTTNYFGTRPEINANYVQVGEGYQATSNNETIGSCSFNNAHQTNINMHTSNGNYQNNPEFNVNQPFANHQGDAPSVLAAQINDLRRYFHQQSYYMPTDEELFRISKTNEFYALTIRAWLHNNLFWSRQYHDLRNAARIAPSQVGQVGQVVPQETNRQVDHAQYERQRNANRNQCSNNDVENNMNLANNRSTSSEFSTPVDPLQQQVDDVDLLQEKQNESKAVSEAPSPTLNDYHKEILQAYYQHWQYPGITDFKFLADLLAVDVCPVLYWFKCQHSYSMGRVGYFCRKCNAVLTTYFNLVGHAKEICYKADFRKLSAKSRTAAKKVKRLLGG